MMTSFTNNAAVATDLPEPHVVNGVRILGPEFFAVDTEGKPLSPIASAFPKYRTVVTGRGIHAMRVATMVDHLRKSVQENEHRDLTEEEEAEVYEDAVALLIRDSVIIIRSDPSNMERVFAADAMLQSLLPKERIQFTGIHLPQVRKQLRRHGESWRISPPPRSVEEAVRYIRSNQVHVSTGATYYQNSPTGGRFLTYEEFTHIRPLLRADREEALARLKEIVELSQVLNKQGAPELSFFIQDDRKLTSQALENVIAALEYASSPEESGQAEGLFDRFARAFAEAAGAELAVDDEGSAAWRTAMFCRLYDISERMLEEWALGLSREFHLNVRWLPGARIADNAIYFEPNVEARTRSLISHYVQTWPEVAFINIGRVESSQTHRDRTGEEREVYLAVIGQADGSESIRIIRMIKWDVMHRIKKGIPYTQAINETLQYRQYIFDRLRAAKALGIPIPSFKEIWLKDEVAGFEPIPVFFFDRQYIPGMVTDKIPAPLYGREGFVVRLARLLGIAAAASLVIGRASPLTRSIYFDDGDEVIQLSDDCLPERMIISETTGSFTDWTSPMAQMLPHFLWHVGGHLERARAQGVAPRELADAADAFADALVEEIRRMQQLLGDPASDLWSLFSDRGQEPGGIRSRWEGVLHRLQGTDADELRRTIAESSLLAQYRA